MSSTFSDLQNDVINALHPSIKAQTAYSTDEVKRFLNRAYTDFAKRTRCIKGSVDIVSVAQRRIYTSGNGIIDSSIAFVDSDPDTITDSNSNFVNRGFQSYQQIVVNNSQNNDGVYTAETIAAGTLTLNSDDELTAEAASATIEIIPKLSYILEPYEVRLIKSGETNQGYLLNPYKGGHDNLPRTNQYSDTPAYFWTRGSGAMGEFEFGTWPVLNADSDTIRIHARMYPWLKMVANTDRPLLLEKDREALPLYVLWKMYRQYSYINPEWMKLSREYQRDYFDMINECITSKVVDSVDGFPEVFDEYNEANW